MPRRFILILFLILVRFSELFAQKEYNIWYFGQNAGITFNTNPPSALMDGKLVSLESSSGICDKTGNLLFYTNGDTIWNRYHQYMKNSLPAWDHWINSSVQGSIVIPKPGSDSLYYLFTTDGTEVWTDSLRYSIVNMKGDNGRGEIIVHHKGLLPKPSEGMAITRHANGKDIWIGCVDKTAGNFNCIRTVDGEISSTIISSTFVCPYPYITSAKFSPDGKILAGNFGHGNFFSLFHFNNATGQITDRLDITILGYSFSAQEFSHNSRFFYHSKSYNIIDSSQEESVVQYDLSHWNADSIEQSAYEVFSSPVTPDYIGGLQLGPDKKIYLFRMGTGLDKLSVIDSPYRKGVACGLREDALSLAGRMLTAGGPYYPTFLFRKSPLKLGEDTTLCEGDSITLDIGKIEYDHILWNTGDTVPSIVTKQTGAYSVTVILGADTLVDTVKVTIRKKFPVYLGGDTAFCGKFSHLLNAGMHAKSYQWNTGDTTVTIMVDQPGMYAVAIKDSNSCPAGDTILIDQLLPPSIDLSYDSINCEYVYLDASPRQTGAQYQWSTGDTSVSIQVDTKGKYNLVISNRFCSITQSIMVDRTGCDMTYFIPNAFTPQQDGINETFKIIGRNIEQVTIKIYNRWGAKVFEGQEWDGTYEGKPCQPDTYVYSITIIGSTKGKQDIKQVYGDITLLR